MPIFLKNVIRTVFEINFQELIFSNYENIFRRRNENGAFQIKILDIYCCYNLFFPATFINFHDMSCVISIFVVYAFAAVKIFIIINK